jgi:hypothetical protein
VIAVLVHLPAVALVAYALSLILISGIQVATLLVAVLACGLAYVLRPRLGRLPKGVVLLQRAQAPALFEITDEMGLTRFDRHVF